MLNDIERAIVDRSKRKHGNTITAEQLEAKIAKTEFFLPEGCDITQCRITLDNGYVVIGETYCLDEGAGQDLAFTAAFNKLWELEGYMRTERAYTTAVNEGAKVVKQ